MSGEVTLYGIPTCDICKKAEKALVAAGYAVRFRDVRAAPLDEAEWAELLVEFGDRLVNRNSTTWRGLNDWMKAAEADVQLIRHPTLMQRPLLRDRSRMTLGWDAKAQGLWGL
ncbi:arsenate reductase family protein [Phaeovulum sp.]|jgi:arsenate reductase-like glutaredoxin family protein|uniref:arsenate reductase family protein n=1 Tax=Phaeovulum sp. TaxID=2934796 RepID=UPI00273183D3|nr:ArsC/Spx/MgsR family protein [Phaeovulum sp.]MDP1668496.1 ArsC/Spx/MgsR family protein [Phaeovulum sp.]MDZ4118779.1 ArsC/Spx/MgsR family protein [Phaeovulum sp.]